MTVYKIVENEMTKYTKCCHKMIVDGMSVDEIIADKMN